MRRTAMRSAKKNARFRIGANIVARRRCQAEVAHLRNRLAVARRDWDGGRLGVLTAAHDDAGATEMIPHRQRLSLRIEARDDPCRVHSGLAVLSTTRGGIGQPGALVGLRRSMGDTMVDER